MDASVALKWFLPVEREPDGALARSIIGRLSLCTTELAVYEVANILTRRSRWTAEPIVSALSLLREICGDPVPLRREDYATTTRLAIEHDLTFYDAAYAAIAARTRRVLLSADRDLLEPGLALSLADVDEGA